MALIPTLVEEASHKHRVASVSTPSLLVMSMGRSVDMGMGIGFLTMCLDVGLSVGWD